MSYVYHNMSDEVPNLRNIFVTDRDCCFIVLSFPQAEDWVIAHEANATGFIELLNEQFYLTQNERNALNESQEVADWRAKLEGELMENGCIRNQFGFECRPLDRLNQHVVYDVTKNFIPRSTIGCLVNLVVQGIDRYLNEIDERLVNICMQMGNSIVVQVKKENVDLMLPYLKQAMQVPLKCGGYEFVLPIDDVRISMDSMADLVAIDWETI